MVFMARAAEPMLPGWLVEQRTILMLLKILLVFNFGNVIKNAKIAF